MSSLSQRSAIEERRFAPRTQTITAIDIGATKVVSFVAQISNQPGPLRVAGVGMQPHAGMSNGTIADLEKTSQAIRQAVHNAEIMAGSATPRVVLSVSGFGLRTETTEGMLSLSSGEVSNQDKRRVVAIALQNMRMSERQTLHVTPRFFAVDGHKLAEPLGHLGRQLMVRLSVVSIPTQHWRTLNLCVEKADLDVAAMVAAPYASALAVLDEDEIETGALLVELGARSTSAALFHNGGLAHISAVPIGSDYITLDIAQGLSTSNAVAERLKVMHGSAIANLAEDHQMIDLTRINDNGHEQTTQVARSILTSIVRPRVEEMLEFLRDNLRNAGLERPAAARRIVLTGGGASLAGVRELAAKVLEGHVRIGRPQRYQNLGDMASTPGFAACAGLLRWDAAKYVDLAHIPPAKIEPPKDVLAKAVAWLRDNF